MKDHSLLLEQFVVFLSVDRGLRSNSIAAYCQDVSLFLKDGNIQSLEEITQDRVLSFIEKRAKAKEAETTIARRLIALKIFFSFLKDGKKIAQTPIIEHPKIWKRLPSVLTPAEVDALLIKPSQDTSIRPDVACRDTAILHTLYSTGIRVSELCGLRIGDVSDAFVRVTGKGSKTRLVPLGTRAVQAIDDYLVAAREAWQKKYPEENSLFVSLKGKPLDRTTVWKRIRYYAEQVTHKNVSPHSLRHAFATHLLDNQADLRVIQEMLGHARISSTEVYTHVAADSLIEKFFTYHPRNL